MLFLMLLLMTAALVYQLLALVSLWRFFQKPLAAAALPEPPGFTVFKPVKGLDPETRECLMTFLAQDYHPYQVLFGVADPGDPVLSVERTTYDSDGVIIEFCQSILRADRYRYSVELRDV